ncbi:MAG: DUF4395 domain-containing protein [Deltaproteobacteria bacterium]
MEETRSIVDYSALRFNQAAIIALVVAGFILDVPLLPTIVASVLLAGSITPNLALFKLTYKYVALPLKLVRPDPVEDSPAPHAFAQLLGGIVLASAVIFLRLGLPLAGWTLAWVVVLLAAANLFFGFCAGCFVYFQLGKIGVPGFQPRRELEG